MGLRGPFGFGQVTPQTKTVVGGRMDVQKQIAKGSRGDAIIYLQDTSPTLGVHLHQDIANPCFISRIFEGDNVMSISVDGLGKLAGGKQILRQKQDGDVANLW